LSETAPTIANRKVEKNVLGTVGEIMTDTHIKIKPLPADVGRGASVSIGRGQVLSGELWVKGAGVMEGYLYDPNSTAEAFDDEGYFNTGDIATVVSTKGLFGYGR